MKYDSIVIGAGLGGMSAALELSRKGKKTLLLEQHNLPGGFASSFVRGRFEFEPSLHELGGRRADDEAPGAVRYLTEDADLDVNLIELPEAYRVIITESGIDVSIPFGKENVIDVIEKEVPGSREPVKKYFDLCRDIQAAFGYLSKNKDNINYLQILKKYGNFVRTGAYTAQEIIDTLKIPQKAQDIMAPYWCYLGVPLNRVSFPIWGTLLTSFFSNSRAVIPTMRSHEISSAFIAKFESYGGTYRPNARVKQINTESGTVKSVTLESGELIQTEHIISNASPTSVFSTLVHPTQEIPTAAIQNINSRKEGFGLSVVYLGLNKSARELGLNEYSYFIAPHMNTEKLYESTYHRDAAELMQASVCINAAIPEASPPGTCMLTMTVGQQGDAWADVLPENYQAEKQRLAEILIDQFESAVGCNLRDHIEEIEVATPVTMARYTGAYNGIVYGYEPEPWDSVIPRALNLEKENYLKGLQFCGGFSYRSHGYASSLLSGKDAALKTIKDMEKTK